MLPMLLVILASSFLLAQPTLGGKISKASNLTRTRGEVRQSLMESESAAGFELVPQLDKHQVRLLSYLTIYSLSLPEQTYKHS